MNNTVESGSRITEATYLSCEEFIHTISWIYMNDVKLKIRGRLEMEGIILMLTATGKGGAGKKPSPYF